MLDRQPRAISIYLRHGELQREQDFVTCADELGEAEAMLHEVCADPEVELPRAAVLDVGVIAGRGRAVVEQNAASGTGIYGCDPAAVLEVLRHAAEPAFTPACGNCRGVGDGDGKVVLATKIRKATPGSRFLTALMAQWMTRFQMFRLQQGHQGAVGLSVKNHDIWIHRAKPRPSINDVPHCRSLPARRQ